MNQWHNAHAMVNLAVVLRIYTAQVVSAYVYDVDMAATKKNMGCDRSG